MHGLHLGTNTKCFNDKTLSYSSVRFFFNLPSYRPIYHCPLTLLSSFHLWTLIQGHNTFWSPSRFSGILSSPFLAFLPFLSHDPHCQSSQRFFSCILLFVFLPVSHSYHFWSQINPLKRIKLPQFIIIILDPNLVTNTEEEHALSAQRKRYFPYYS